tara:strand:- start:4766 stop:5503 length:738 start_codon:yes stop_codon:yes gene_type:complete
MTTNIIGNKIIDGISLFCACKNREENLLKSLDSWLSFDEVDEIIIVDWFSDEPVRIKNDRVLVVRVEDEKSWYLTASFNLAARFTSRKNICKVDCDYTLGKNFFSEYVLSEEVFYAGNYELARDWNERFLNGLLYISRKNFFDVNGYNEYLTHYGWDDSDLYKRLIENCKERLDIHPDFASHIEHSNEIRGISDNFWDDWPKNAGRTIKNVEISKQNLWSNDNSMASYHIIKKDGDYICQRKTKQ